MCKIKIIVAVTENMVIGIKTTFHGHYQLTLSILKRRQMDIQ
jgi:hypothetical protein